MENGRSLYDLNVYYIESLKLELKIVKYML